MPTTTDPNDSRLKETRQDGQQAAYLVLPQEEVKKGHRRLLRFKYRHVGTRPDPKNTTRTLTDEEKEQYKGFGYVLFEEYPPTGSQDTNIVGRFWTQAQLDSGCGGKTELGRAIAETYARDPAFYGATFCSTCQKHFPVAEFVWEPDGSRVGS